MLKNINKTQTSSRWTTTGKFQIPRRSHRLTSHPPSWTMSLPIIPFHKSIQHPLQGAIHHQTDIYTLKNSQSEDASGRLPGSLRRWKKKNCTSGWTKQKWSSARIAAEPLLRVAFTCTLEAAKEASQERRKDLLVTKWRQDHQMHQLKVAHHSQRERQPQRKWNHRPWWRRKLRTISLMRM